MTSQKGSSAKGNHPETSTFDNIIISVQVSLGFAFLYLGAFLLRISAWLLSIVPLTAMELHTAYYRASFDKEHGEGSADLMISFYDAYLRPDIEEKSGIEWVRT